MKRIQSIACIALFISAASLLVTGCKTHEEMQSASGVSVSVTKCAVCGESLGDKTSISQHNGQSVKLCCQDCLTKFNQDPDKYVAKLKEER